jgi:hypothetical protein
MTRLAMLAAAFVAGLLVAVAMAPRAEAWTDYVPVYERAGGIFGIPGQGSAGWWGAWASLGDGRFMWRDPHTGAITPGGIESTSIRNCGGTEWYVLESFDWSDTAKLRIETIRATLSDLKTGATFDVTTACGTGPVGHPYALNKLVDWPYRMRVWGRVYNPDGRSVAIMFYWESDHYPPAPKLNECMGVTVPAIHQTEVWASADLTGKVTEWVRGSGTPPFDAFGKPLVPQTVHEFDHWNGRGYGPLYSSQSKGGPVVCLHHRWTW